MQAYIEPIKSALFIFPFVALLFTLPFMFVQYRRYGAILLLRTAICYSFILYLMCAYFLTILPLPEWETVARLTSPTIQLIPFRETVDLIKNAPVNWHNPATYYKLFYNRDFFQIIANVLMTVPFGIYLRYYFRCSFKKTVLLSLGLSLVFELTQLSALFGIYPRPYRLADVDDLMTNTLGGAVGYWIAPLFMKILPTKERMDEVAYSRGTQVSVTRRIFAAMLDWVFLLIVGMALLWALMPTLSTATPWQTVWTLFGLYAAGVLIYFSLGTWFLRGRTPGKLLMHLRLVDKRTDGRPKLWQCVVRYVTLYIVVLPAPAIVLSLLLTGTTEPISLWAVLGCIVLLLIYITFWLILAIHVFTHSISLLHGKISITRDESTLFAKQEKTAAAVQQADDVQGAQASLQG